MSYESVMVAFAGGATRVHGALKKVMFLQSNDYSILIFEDGREMGSGLRAQQAA